MNSLCITTVHPRICEFFNSHPHLVFDDMIVSFIEMVENMNNSVDFTSINVCKNQCAHVLTLINKLKNLSNQYTNIWTEDFIVEKNNYLASLKSLLPDSPDSTFYQSITNQFSQSIATILYNNLYNQQCKIGPLIKQYTLFVASNTDILFQKKNPLLFPEFETNFETNTKQFISNINAAFKKFVQTKEELASSLDLNENPGLIYELTNLANSFQSNTTSSFESVLSKTFQTASVSTDSPNFFYLSRENRPTLFIELYQYKDKNISQQEVQQFQKHSTEKNMHSILISQYTGITGKSHFFIELAHNRVLVYLHLFENNSEKIQMAVDIIDTLSSKLSEFYLDNESKYSIPKDILDDVNREYQSFIHQKENIMTFIKDSNKKLLSQIDEFKFISLDKYLSTRYSSIKKQGYTCDLCNSFHVPTLKGLAAHKRGCIRKNSIQPDSIGTGIDTTTNIICKPIL